MGPTRHSRYSPFRFNEPANSEQLNTAPYSSIPAVNAAGEVNILQTSSKGPDSAEIMGVQSVHFGLAPPSSSLKSRIPTKFCPPQKSTSSNPAIDRDCAPFGKSSNDHSLPSNRSNPRLLATAMRLGSLTEMYGQWVPPPIDFRSKCWMIARDASVCAQHGLPPKTCRTKRRSRRGNNREYQNVGIEPVNTLSICESVF